MVLLELEICERAVKCTVLILLMIVALPGVVSGSVGLRYGGTYDGGSLVFLDHFSLLKAHFQRMMSIFILIATFTN